MVRAQTAESSMGEILKELDGMRGPAPGQNRRSAARLPFRTALVAIIPSEKTPTRITLSASDISGSGLGFTSHYPLQEQQRLVIMLKVDRLPPRLILARIAHAQRISAGIVKAGAEFIECIRDPKGTGQYPARWQA